MELEKETGVWRERDDSNDKIYKVDMPSVQELNIISINNIISSLIR